MVSKEDFVRLVSKARPLPAEELAEIDGQYEAAAEAARQLAASMPGIGIVSVTKRLNAFFAVCRHLDKLVESGEISASEGQLSLLILRVANRTFLKAATMFDLRSSRFDTRPRAELPRSAREYLAGLQMYG